ncbi:MAG: hypothetical protein Q8Q33_04160 [Chlamydiota bacterium]|nr:hypothetical protein [Chlamydiota bacterium]
MVIMFKKIIFIIVIFSFSSNFMHAEEDDKSVQKSILDLSSLTSLQIESQYGHIDEIWIPSADFYQQKSSTASNKDQIKAPVSPKIVVHIRDAHLAYDAQINIAYLLKSIADQFSVHTVCIEGAWTRLNTKPFLEYTDPMVREQVLATWLREGKMNGAEFALSVLGVDATLFGIEDRDIYKNNVKAFSDLYPYRNEAFFSSSVIMSQINALKGEVFSVPLKNFEQEVMRYRDGELGLTDFVLVLLKKYGSSISELPDRYPQLHLLEQQLGLEQDIDFAKAQEERSGFIRDASQKLIKEDLKDLIAKSFAYRLGRLPSYDYYQHLEKITHLVFKTTTEFEAVFPNLAKYLQYEKLGHDISLKNLYLEIDNIILQLYKHLAKTEDEKQLISYSQNIYLANRLFQLELTSGELDTYMANPNQYAIDGVLQEIKQMSAKYKVALRDDLDFVDESLINKCLPYALEFYQTALKRDTVLVSNLLKTMDEQNTNQAVLILGGFHTHGIKAIFQEKGIAYAVITPAMQENITYVPYVERLLGIKPSLEQFLDYLKRIRDDKTSVIGSQSLKESMT